MYKIDNAGQFQNSRNGCVVNDLEIICVIKSYMLYLSCYLNSLVVIRMKLLETIKLLADETRFKIVKLLLTQDFCVGALAKRLGISDAAVSQHIQILRKGGLLKGEKRGYWTHYSVERHVLDQLAEQLKELADLSTSRQSNCLQTSVKQTRSTVKKNEMCKCGCESPEMLKENPEKCSKEQIKECHGEQETHPYKE
jgi:ArsR family transcriptional regulator, arsenate/arsenite/antimonite-responsive transcriptional repressor